MVNALLTPVKDTFLKLQSKLSALLSTLRQRVQSVLEKKAGKQFVKQPPKVAAKTARYR